MEPNSVTMPKNNAQRTGKSYNMTHIQVQRAAQGHLCRYAAYTTKSDMHTNFGDSTWLLIFPMTVLVGMVVMGIVNFIRLVL